MQFVVNIIAEQVYRLLAAAPILKANHPGLVSYIPEQSIPICEPMFRWSNFKSRVDSYI